MNIRKTVIGMSAASFLTLQALLPTAASASCQVSNHKVSSNDAYPGHVITYGDRGSDVKEVQNLLNKRRLPVKVDGIFGKETLHQVKQFQQNRQLTVDGVVGAVTWKALHELPFPYPGHVVKRGDSGMNVTYIQARLEDGGGSIKIDGIFGLKTEAKVKEFQKKNHLKADGIVGLKTWGALFNY